MAEKIASGYVEIKTEIDRLRKEMRDVRDTVNGAASDVEKRTTTASKNIEGAFSKAGKAILGIWAAIQAAQGAVNLTKEFINAASAAEQYQTRLKVLLGSQQEGNRMFQEMADYAGRVPFEFANIMEAATSLSGVMKGGVDEVTEWMPLVGDLAAATGLSIQETTGQIIRMYSAGAASADMFRERGVLAMLGFTAGVSYTAEETRRKLIEAWKDPESQFRNATDEMKETWKGTTSMLSDAWFRFSKSMGENIVGELTPAVKMLTDALNLLAESLEARTSLDAYDELLKKQKQLSIQQKLLTRAEELGNASAWDAYNTRIEKLKEEIYQLKKKLDITVAISEVPASAAGTAAIPESVVRATGMEEMEVAYAQGLDEQRMLNELELEKQNAEEKKKLKEELWNWEIEKAAEYDDAMLSAHEMELEKLRERQEEERALKEEWFQWELERTIAHDDALMDAHEAMLDYEKKLVAQKEKLEKSKEQLMSRSASSQFKIATSLGEALLHFAGANSKEIFMVMKAVEVGKAVVAAHSAAALALANPPGPPWTIPISKAALATGLWHAGAIAATAIGQLAASSGGGVGGGTYTSPAVTTSAQTARAIEPLPETSAEQKGTLNINIEGDFFGDEYFVEMLAEKISEAVEDKEVRLVASNSRYAEALS